MQNDAEQRALIERSRELSQASISVNKQDRGQSVYRIEIDLSKERDRMEPYKISFPFKTIVMEESSNPAAFVLVRPTTDEEHQSHFRLGYKDGYMVGETIPQAFLHWPAQPAKIVLIAHTNAEFRSGSQVSLNAGGVSISEGSVLKQLAPVTLVATTPTKILDQNLFRKVATVINKTGADIWVGGPTVSNTGVAEGFPLKSGEYVSWKNTSELWGYSVPGGKIVIMEQE